MFNFEYLKKKKIQQPIHLCQTCRSRRGESLGFVATSRLHDPPVFGGRSGPLRLPQIRLQSRTSEHAQFLPGSRFPSVHDPVDERSQSGSHLARFQESLNQQHVRIKPHPTTCVCTFATLFHHLFLSFFLDRSELNPSQLDVSTSGGSAHNGSRRSSKAVQEKAADSSFDSTAPDQPATGASCRLMIPL